MSLKDLANTHVFGQSLDPEVRTASANGSGVDFRDCGPQVTAVLDVGAASGTNATLDITLEESDDDSTYTAISGASLTQVDQDGDNTQEAKTIFNRSKRYVRAVATIGGTTPSFACNVSLIARHMSY